MVGMLQTDRKRSYQSHLLQTIITPTTKTLQKSYEGH